MRLFVALELTEPVLQSIDALITRLKPAAELQWSVVSNLHITTKFIGEFPEERLGELAAALQARPKTGPIPIRVEGLGWFPNPHAPRVFWAGVRSIPLPDGRGSEIADLGQKTDQATAALGVPPETREFHPHLTLARVKTAVPLAPLRQAVAQLETVEFGACTAHSQFLYLSQNSVYTKIEEFPL